jgi:DNA-binding NarL/FixJ family response regulator
MNTSVRGRARVLLADDYDRMLRLVTTLLSLEFEVVGSARNGREAVEAAQRMEPDFLVMDVEMPGMNGIEAARALTAMGSSTKVILLSGVENDAFASAAIGGCVHAYVYKSLTVRDLPRALKAVAAGERFLSKHTA